MKELEIVLHRGWFFRLYFRIDNCVDWNIGRDINMDAQGYYNTIILIKIR